MNTPSHYAPTGSTITPWELQKQMESSGIVFVDARRTDGMEYAFRVKGGLEGLMEDLKKGAHCFLEAAEFLRQKLEETGKAESSSISEEWHNPENVPSSLVGDDWRFLKKGELPPLHAEIFHIQGGVVTWKHPANNNKLFDPSKTYRVWSTLIRGTEPK